MATTMLRSVGVCRLAAPAASRTLGIVPKFEVSARSRTTRAQSQGEGEGEKSIQRSEASPAPRGGSSLSPLFAPMGGFPSVGRIGSIMKAMEEEMNALTSSFGMPGLFDVETAMAVPTGARVLAVDVQDKGDSLEIKADVPGLTRDDIKVTISPDNVLTISGEKRSETKEEGEGWLRAERSYGSFMRRFRLPNDVDVEGVKATTREGELTLTVPKKEGHKHKEIEVQVGG